MSLRKESEDRLKMYFKPELEICIESLSAGLAARTGGADRVELCSALVAGGLTPSHALIAAAVEQTGLPVHVLVRPRTGGFVYSSEEFRIIQRDIEHAQNLGAKGCVIGILRPDGSVDVERTRELVQQAAPMQVTFHRAFDRSRNLAESLEQVIEAGCTRILTSGGKPTAGEAAPMLAALVAQSNTRIRIAAGGGVTLASAAELLKLTPIDLHASLRHRTNTVAKQDTDSLWKSESTDTVDPVEVRAMAELLRRSTDTPLHSA
jgi:copper homeostasis protein